MAPSAKKEWMKVVNVETLEMRESSWHGYDDDNDDDNVHNNDHAIAVRTVVDGTKERLRRIKGQVGILCLS